MRFGPLEDQAVAGESPEQAFKRWCIAHDADAPAG